MKIQIDHYHASHTVTIDDGVADLNTIVPLLKGLLVAVGYHPSSVDEYFTEEEWFPEGSDCNEEIDTPTKRWPRDFDGAHSTVNKNIDIFNDESYG
jgi:hypothetical protein